MLYALCTGRAAFRGNSSMATLRKVCEQRPRPIQELNPEIPFWLVGIIEKLHAKDPADRYGSAAEVADLLGRCLAHVQQPASASLPAELQPNRNRRAMALWGTLPVGLILAALVCWPGAREAVGQAVSFVATVLRLKTPEGTLVVETEDPGIGIKLDDSELVVNGAGMKELRLSVGKHSVQALKGRRVLRDDWVTISRGGRTVLRVRREEEPEQPPTTGAAPGRFEDLKAKLSPDHPDTLMTMHNLANSYDALGRNVEALKLREHTLAMQKAKLGSDHPDTLMAMLALAKSYQALGRQTEALRLREQTLVLMKAKLGSDHPDTLTCMSGLAVSYDALGRYAEALELDEATLALRKAKLGSDHPDTLTSMSNLAETYQALGRQAEALRLREHTLALRKAKLGPDHPDTLTSMSGLAKSYQALGRQAEALKLREHTLALRRAKLGSDHPDILVSMNDLADSFEALGRQAEALKLREHTLALQKARLSPDHPDTLRSRLGVARYLAQLGRGAEAAADCQRAAETWEKLGASDAQSLYNAACFRAVTAAALPRPTRRPREPNGRRPRPTGPWPGSNGPSPPGTATPRTWPRTTTSTRCGTGPTSRS